jgi:DNA-binding NarL/FixJ family response regulator
MVEINSKVINVCIVEEMEIYREFYKSLFTEDIHVKILDTIRDNDFTALRMAIVTHHPDVILFGVKNLEQRIVKELGDIRKKLPNLGILLLIMNYNPDSIQYLKKLAASGESGIGVFFRYSLQRVDQLYKMLGSVSDGQIIIDPTLSSVIFSEKKIPAVLKKLTHRELEILSLIAKGYTNSAIGEALFIDIETVQHHITNIYGKILAEADIKNKHLRVSASRMYMENMGSLVAVPAAE